MRPKRRFSYPRTPYDDCVKFIADCYDKAAGLLPETVVPAELGMPTKMAALSYKARLLLYAASPLVNGNPDYVGFNNPDGTPLMNTTYDREKWKLAMDAAEAAIQLSEKSGQNGGKQNYYLYTNIDSTLDEFEQGVKNYHGAFVDQLWNGEEFIMAKGAETGVQNIQRYGGPRSIAGDMSKGWKTTCKADDGGRRDVLHQERTAARRRPADQATPTSIASRRATARRCCTATANPASTPASASTAGRSRSTVRPSRSNCAAASCTAAR